MITVLLGRSTWFAGGIALIDTSNLQRFQPGLHARRPQTLCRPRTIFGLLRLTLTQVYSPVDPST